jgi:hypothetical protein
MIKIDNKMYIYFAVMIVLSGCKAKKEADLYGTYVAKYPFGTEKLILYSNGEYSQEVNVVVDGKSKTVTNTSCWKYDPTTGYLTLEKALIVDDWDELKKEFDKPVQGVSVKPVSKLTPWSPIKIEINPDCGYSYVKENGSNTAK